MLCEHCKRCWNMQGLDASPCIKQILYIESVSFFYFLSLSIVVAFYDTIFFCLVCQNSTVRSLSSSCLYTFVSAINANDTDRKLHRSSTRTRTSASTRTTSSNWLNKCLNKSFVKDNAKSFIESEGNCGRACRMMQPLAHIYQCIHIYQRICSAKFM